MAANSFAGANNYYIYALPQADRLAILNGMQAAGMKVLRTLVTGVAAGQKLSDNIAVPDLEANGIGNYDDTVLNLIDQLTVDAHVRGIKLLIGMYSKNALQAGDIYGSTFGVEGFYTNPTAINAFNQRITHILNGHKNALIGNRTWNNLSAYIFGLEPQNDRSTWQSHLSWICIAAQQIRNNVGDRNQLIFTGGGSAGASVQPTFFGSSCPAIDVVAIHDYTELRFESSLSVNVPDPFPTTGSLVGSGRTANIDSNVQKINNYKVPGVTGNLSATPDPHQDQDYEARIRIQVNGADWSTTSTASQATGALTNAPFDFSASLAL
ncbi:glycoside hydrolase family 5 protein [Mycena metata]|uniref:Glycoside hydrolase family 5 protein n=1 Tax=Mycena metata TaxID=1033252 RepID=A0AAD7JKE5_9AGAR|nr:glycoside hydrolase family 5 protein [Mycena metata]